MGEFLVFPEDGGDGDIPLDSRAGGGAMNSGGAGKFTMESGDFDLILLLGLKFSTIEGLLDKEWDFEEKRCELEPGLGRFSPDPLRAGLCFSPVDPLGEKNSSSSSEPMLLAAPFL